MKAPSNEEVWADIETAATIDTHNPETKNSVAANLKLLPNKQGPPVSDINIVTAADKTVSSQTPNPTRALSIARLNQLENYSRDPDIPTFRLDEAQMIMTETFPNQPRMRGQQLPATIANVKHMLDTHGISVRYNVIKKKLQIALPGNRGTADNADNVAAITINSLAAQNGMPIGPIADYVAVLGDRNAYNPVAEWITGNPWDGKDRLPEMYATITAREGFPETLKNAVIYRWLLSAAAAATMPAGFKARGVLTLQGPQGLGKTSWVRGLVSDEVLRETMVKVDHHMDGSLKDSVLGAITHWIVEIGELDSSFKKDIARLKGFLTADFDKVRRPYAHGESEYPRRTVFCATVNESNFLVDTTGNSRWWTIPVTHINYTHGIDMQQVFAQLADAIQRGEQWWLKPEEETLLDACNSEHLTVSVIRERLLAVVDMELIGKPDNPAMTAIGVLNELAFDCPTNQQCKECAAILRQLFGDSKKINGQQKWRIPIKKSGTYGQD